MPGDIRPQSRRYECDDALRDVGSAGPYRTEKEL